MRELRGMLLTLCMAGMPALSPPPAAAAAGDLDPTFGIAGQVTTDFVGTEDQAGGMAVQADGKIVLAGSTLVPNGFGAKDFALARYTAAGALDATFGNGGRVTTHWPQSFYSVARSIKLQSDGKIVVAGYTDSGLTPPGGMNQQFAVARYLADGSVDTSFGSNGLVVTDFGEYYDLALALAIQPDGKIVAGGANWLGSGYLDPANFALARYNGDGSLDATFGDGGKVVTSLNGEADIIFGLALDAQNRIVTGGFVFGNSLGGISAGLARYLPDGTLDSTFGDGGTVITDFADAGFRSDEVAAIALQPDGKIVTAGRSQSSSAPDGLFVTRYDADGTLDDTFGEGGWVNILIGGFDTEGYAVAVDKKGSIVVGGQTGALGFATITGMAFSLDTSSTVSSFALIRLLSDGSPDASFGDAGIVTTRFANDEGYSDAIGTIDPNAHGILVAGLARSSNHDMSTFTSNADFALARYDDGYPIFADGFDPSANPGKPLKHHPLPKQHGRITAQARAHFDLRVITCALLCRLRDAL